MSRDVDDVVGATHDPQVAVLVQMAGVRGFVVAVEAAQVRLLEALFVVPQGGQAARREGKPQNDEEAPARSPGTNGYKIETGFELNAVSMSTATACMMTVIAPH